MIELLQFLKEDIRPFFQDVKSDIKSIATSLGQIAAYCVDQQAARKAELEGAKHKAEKKPQ